MNTPAVSREQVVEAVKQLPLEALPEIAQFIEFVRFKGQMNPLVHDRASNDPNKPRAAIIRTAQGMFSDVPTSSEEFARRKLDEIEREDRVA